MRILVVEDERLLCDGIAEDLRLEKYTADLFHFGLTEDLLRLWSGGL